jgi:hypothetical protein
MLPAPELEGREVLAGPDPSVCMVKGVMFAARKHFLLETFGSSGYYDVLCRLSPATLEYLRNPQATQWCEFSSVIECDRTIWERYHTTEPQILSLVGAASAELGISRVFRSLDTEELLTFLSGIARFHEIYLKYGSVSFEKKERGARMSYHDYPCYSPFFCASGFGFYAEVILRHGGTDPEIRHTHCHCRGDGVCTYEIAWR